MAKRLAVNGNHVELTSYHWATICALMELWQHLLAWVRTEAHMIGDQEGGILAPQYYLSV